MKPLKLSRLNPAFSPRIKLCGCLFLATLPSLSILLTQVRAQDAETPAEDAPPAENAPPAEVSPPAEAGAPGGAKAGAEAKPRVALPKDGTTPNYWVLDLKPGPVRMIAPRGGLASGKVYWYLLYTLENPAKEDREVCVTVSAASDRGKTYTNLFLPDVERAIERQEGRLLWGKDDEFEVTSKRDAGNPRSRYVTLRAGEKRQSVAVFNRLDPSANTITISVSGLSNEIRPVARAEGPRALHERVRELTYQRPGDEFAITRDSFQLVGEQWVKRQVEAVAATAVKKG